MSVQLVRPDFDRVVSGLYEAATSTDLWPIALEQLARFTGSRGALLTRPDAEHCGLMHSPGLTDTVAQFFEQGWHQMDLRSDRLIATVKRGFFCDQDITSDEEREASDYYNGFARPAGVPWFAACGTLDADGSILGISLQRTAKEGEFLPSDLRRLSRLEHHTNAALSFSRRFIASEVGRRLEGLNRLDVAAVLLAGDGRVLAANAQAEGMLSGGAMVSVRRGRLTSVQPPARRQLERLVAQSCGADRSGDPAAPPPVRLDGPDGEILLAQAIPMVGAAHDLFGEGRAILTFTPVSGTAAARAGAFGEPDLLAKAFGLTPAEARIAHLLARGQETSAIAEALGVTQGAVRFHLKSILPKAGVNRQAAFVALAASLRRPH